MKLDLDNLPTDVPSLQQLVRELAAKVISLSTKLAYLRAKRYRHSSEKLDKDIEDLEYQIAETESLLLKVGVSLEKEQPKRKPLPDNLPREEVVLDQILLVLPVEGLTFARSVMIPLKFWIMFPLLSK